jgi:beta-RFAP synthase
MIIEGIVTTLDEAGRLNVAPMGPLFDDADAQTFVLRPFQGSTTLRNLIATRQGVFHLIDDPVLLAKAAIGRLDPAEITTLPAQLVQGRVLADSCSYQEFRVRSIDTRHERAEIVAQVVASGRFRDPAGWNRARHAVLEAAILATRIGILPDDEITARWHDLATTVDKTAGPPEREAWGILSRHVDDKIPPSWSNVTGWRISTPSRLHFGLLGWGPQAARLFGGVGLMIDRPGLEIEATPADDWQADGPHASRVLETARRVAARMDDPPKPSRLVVRHAPAEHLGLGLGTQLTLAVTRLVGRSQSASNLDRPETAASATGRGQRSGIGLYGHWHGGLIVDAGRPTSGDPAIPALVAAIPFPLTWWVLVVIPDGTIGLSGPDEVGAFQTLPPPPPQITDRLCRLVLLGLVPAVREQRLEPFGQAVEAIQHEVGRAFSPAQHGRIYATDRSEAIVTLMRSLGLHGVGQSSWGPSLYGFFDGSKSDRLAIEARIREQTGLPRDRLFWTQASRSGAVLSPMRQTFF